MMEMFSHNSLLMKEKGCLTYEKKRDDFSIIPSSGERGIRTLGTVASTPAFQAGSFDHSDISPFEWVAKLTFLRQILNDFLEFYL